MNGELSDLKKKVYFNKNKNKNLIIFIINKIKNYIILDIIYF